MDLQFLIQDHSSMLDCDNLGGKTHLEKAGARQAKAVVLIDLETYDANEVSEISVTNVEGTSRAGNGSSNPDLPCNEILKLPCPTETLVAEVKTSQLEIEGQCEIGMQKESQGELPRDVLGSERESQSEMCGSQWTPGETLGTLSEALGSQGKEQPHSDWVPQHKSETLGEAAGCGGNEQWQSTETIQEVDHSDNEVLTSQNTDRIQDKTLEFHAKSVSSHERLETCAVENIASKEATLTSVQVRSVLTEKILEELGRTGATFVLVDGALEMPHCEAESLPASTPTPSEILDAISQIIPRSQPVDEGVVLQEHSYATTAGSASVQANSGQILQDLNILDSTKCVMQHDIHTDNSNVDCSNVEPSSCEMESSLIPDNQSSPMNISDSLQDADLSSRNESNLVQGSDDIPSSITPGGTAPTDISTTAPGLYSNMELTQLQPLSISNTSILETVQPQKVESDTIQRSDDIPSNMSPRPSEITPTEISTNTLYVSSNIQAPQPPGNVSISNSSLETVQSRNAESCSSPSSDDNSLNDCSDRLSQRTLDNSTSTPGLHSTTQPSGTLQPPTFVSICDSSLEAGKYKALIASPTDLPDSKEKKRLSTKNHRENETPEKRETRLKAQRERARLRRSQESETEREARREKDRKRQQLKRTRNKEMESGDILNGDNKPSEDILHAASQTLQPDGDKVEDRGLPNPISQSSNSVVLTASTEGGELHCSSVVKLGVIPISEDIVPISEDTNPVPISEDTIAVPISEDTNTVPSKRPKMMQDPECTNILVSSEGRTVIDGQQISPAESDTGQSDLCQRGERCDVHERASNPGILPVVTADIPSASDSSVLQREDRDVTASTTAATPIPQDNSNDSAAPENKEDLDMHMKIDLLNNQILSGLTESAPSQTTHELSASQEDKDIPDHVGSSVIETSSVGPKLSLTEGRLALPSVATDVPCEGGFIGETSSAKPDSAVEEDSGDDMDASKLPQKQKNRERVGKRRALETPEQRETRLGQQRERVRERRANETDSQRETRRVRDRIRQQMKRTSESEEKRSKRLLQQREATRRRRALESPEEKQTRRVKDKDRAKQSRESKLAGVVMEWWKK